MTSTNSTTRFDLNGNTIKPMKVCVLGAGSFIGSHLCITLATETQHEVFAIDMDLQRIPQNYDRILFCLVDIAVNHPRLEFLIKESDVIINFYEGVSNKRAIKTCSNLMDVHCAVVKLCLKHEKHLVHFYNAEVYGKTIGSLIPKGCALRMDPDYYALEEDASPCIYGPVENQRWLYASVKQLIERMIYAEGIQNGLAFTIVRPFNCIGDDGPSGVVTCFSNNLLRREPLKLVDGGESKRTFVWINDVIEAVLLMIENPSRANGHIFNVGNPHTEVTLRQLAITMIQVYAKVSEEPAIESPIIDVSSKEFYGEGHDDISMGNPDLTIINTQLGWYPKSDLLDMLKSTLKFQQTAYFKMTKKSTSVMINKSISKPKPRRFWEADHTDPVFGPNEELCVPCNKFYDVNEYSDCPVCLADEAKDKSKRRMSKIAQTKAVKFSRGNDYKG